MESRDGGAKKVHKFNSNKKQGIHKLGLQPQYIALRLLQCQAGAHGVCALETSSS